MFIFENIKCERITCKMNSSSFFEIELFDGSCASFARKSSSLSADTARRPFFLLLLDSASLSTHSQKRIAPHLRARPTR